MFLKNLFIIFAGCWIFVAACGLSLAVVSGSYSLVVRAWASQCGGLSCCRARAQGYSGFSSCATWA